MTRLLKSSDLFNAKSDLIKKLKQKDLPSFELLFDMYASSLCTLVESITKNSDTTSELMVKVFSTIYKTIDQFQENKSTLYIWMLGIARRIALDSKSKSGNDYVSEPREHFAVLKNVNGLQQLIDQLPDDCRTIIHLSYLEGMTAADIARHLRQPIEQVNVCRNKGLGMLTKMMGSHRTSHFSDNELSYVS